jgi:ferritin-like metal-binding protein YciE
MPVQDIQDIFRYDLCQIYDAEQKFIQALSWLASETDDSQVKDIYQRHERETRQQVENLERCFQILGIQREDVTCYAAAGLVRDCEEFHKREASPDFRTEFDLINQDRVEHYEMACYNDLVEKAKLLGQQECQRLLEENLRQEGEMCQRVETSELERSKKMYQPMAAPFEQPQYGQEMGQSPH